MELDATALPPLLPVKTQKVVTDHDISPKDDIPGQIAGGARAAVVGNEVVFNHVVAGG